MTRATRIAAAAKAYLDVVAEVAVKTKNNTNIVEIGGLAHASLAAIIRDVGDELNGPQPQETSSTTTNTA